MTGKAGLAATADPTRETRPQETDHRAADRSPQQSLAAETRTIETRESSISPAGETDADTDVADPQQQTSQHETSLHESEPPAEEPDHQPRIVTRPRALITWSPVESIAAPKQGAITDPAVSEFSPTPDQPANDIVPQQPVATDRCEHTPVASAASAPFVHVDARDNVPARSPAIASLLFGISSWCVLWTPVVGFVLSGLGVLCGLATLLLVPAGRASGAGCALAGIAISSAAVAFAMAPDWEFPHLAKWFSQATESVDRRPPADSEPKPPADDSPPSEVTVRRDHDSSAAAVSRPVRTQPPVFHSFPDPLQLGSVQLQITEVRVGQVPLYNDIFKEDSWSEAELLMIRVYVTNSSSSAQFDYSGWMSEVASLRKIDAALTDDLGNSYSLVSFGTARHVKHATTWEPLQPGESVADAVVFEAPVDGATHFNLTLSARGCDTEDEFRFRIPADAIKH